MNLARCARGHYFDGSKYLSCPHCGTSLLPKQSVSVTPPSTPHPGSVPSSSSSVTVTLPSTAPTSASLDSDEAVTVCRNDKDEAVTVVRALKDDDVHTVTMHSLARGTRPIVGWLLCTAGADKGSDYRLYTGNNSLGRGDKPDIQIYDDQEVSRGVHCTISYDPKQNCFYAVPGLGTITALNGALLDSPHLLKRYDKLTLGCTELTFVPYCEGGFHW